MAVGIRLKLAGGTAEQVDRLNAAIDPDGNPRMDSSFTRPVRWTVVGGCSTSGSRASTLTASRPNASDPRWPPSGLRVHRTFASSPCTSTSLAS